MRERSAVIFPVLITLLVCTNARPAEHALAELGCANCHTTLRHNSTLRERIPDLRSAGLRYNPAWLFEFLQNPTRVRRHLGRARMPNFYIDENEALALVEFLQTQTNIVGAWPALPEAISRPPTRPTHPISAAAFESNLAGGLACLSCHTLNGRGGVTGVELSHVGFREQKEWARRYLVAPEMYGVPHTAMPPQFYVLTNSHFQPILPDPAQKIDVVVDYLFSLNADRKALLDQRYQRARNSATNMSAELGRDIFVALNCAACHRAETVIQPPTNAAPDLTLESARVKPSWLQAYLKKPFAIRPFGFRPGDGSRMPNFNLTTDEISEIVATIGKSAQNPSLQPSPLSAFARDKARAMLTDKLSCLGCHRLDGTGGRIGPDLTAVGQRLQPDYLLNVVQNPRGANPHSIMPRVPLTPNMLHLITSFLLGRTEVSPTTNNYPSLVDHPMALIRPLAESTEARYGQHCAPCHGHTGRGDGFNARYLPRKPTVHSDPEYMSRRPDDTLFDAVHSGGGIMNRSPYMPPWGETFARDEVSALVKHLRTLCRCEGPDWSRDGSR